MILDSLMGIERPVLVRWISFHGHPPAVDIVLFSTDRHQGGNLQFPSLTTTSLKQCMQLNPVMTQENY